VVRDEEFRCLLPPPPHAARKEELSSWNPEQERERAADRPTTA
jgi:hypothetical protein